jgi:predicted dehydrogenase
MTQDPMRGATHAVAREAAGALAATRPVRLASIGLGWWGEVLAGAVARTGGAVVVTGYARSPQAREHFATVIGCRTADSLEAVLADPEVDGVLIATPHSTHLDLIRRAAAAGKHVFVEKPLTLRHADGVAAVAAARAAGVILQVGHHRRRSPALRRLKQLVADGALGTISMLESNLSTSMGLEVRDGWRTDPEESPLGGLTALGVHMIDNLIHLAGPVVAVSALSRRTLARNATDEVTMLTLEFAGGALGHVGTSVVTPKLCTTSAHGDLGAAFSEEEGSRLFVQRLGETTRIEVADLSGPDALDDQMVEFVRCIRDGVAPEVGGPEALEVVAVVEAAVRSAAEGRVVTIAEVRSTSTPMTAADRADV